MHDESKSPKQVRPAEPAPPRTWQAGTHDDDGADGRRPDETGIRAFLRKLSMLFSLDPRSGSR